MAIITVKPLNESMEAIRTGAPNFDDATTPVPPLVAAIDGDNTDDDADDLLLSTTILVVSVDGDDVEAINGFGSSS
jgi:hypothetical protein